MGDRASILFFDKVQVSPVVYLHWHGHRVPEWITELRERMADRLWDAPYATARFVGICHTHISGNLSLGIRSCDLRLPDLTQPSLLDFHNPGDAGVVIVSTGDFTWRAFGGYLAKRSLLPPSN